MKVILYIVLFFTIITILIMLWNRLYFEIHLARANKILNKGLKRATRQQIKTFSKELNKTLYIVVDALTDNYNELIQNINNIEEKR